MNSFFKRPINTNWNAQPHGRPCAGLSRFALLGLCSLLGACSLLGSKPQPSQHTYALDSGAALVPAARPVSTGTRVLLVEQPTAAPGYDSTRMVYMRQPQSLEAFSQSSWVDTPARMLAPLMVQALQESGVFRAVLLAPTATRSDLRLDTSVVRLQQDFLHTPSSVRLSLQVRLSDSATHELLAWTVLDVVQPAASEDAAGGSAAASAAVQEALQQLLRFVQAAPVGR